MKHHPLAPYRDPKADDWWLAFTFWSFLAFVALMGGLVTWSHYKTRQSIQRHKEEERHHVVAAAPSPEVVAGSTKARLT
ncbi:hypothetical protein Pan216_06810 [Planctomycetes bacterium Pan216]|uniref:Uncharacterized protein n=1 Tax=Kolteria novifilia TaxID=2527975 RepID=A0A518AYP4_9BACT|nr:hypothetical protein Pan216_06810 [Planctomycetes bacterium Pan216]